MQYETKTHKIHNNYRCLSLFVERTACWPIMHDRVNVAVNWVCACQAVHTISSVLWAPR